jgi:predicted ArsR family transcriptional regulator
MRPARPAHLAVAIMVSLLIEGPATVQDIADETGLTEQSVRDYMRAMRKRRAVHVAAWEHDKAGRQTRAAYRLGRKPDAARVPPRTNADRMKHYRARKKDAQLLGIAA